MQIRNATKSDILGVHSIYLKGYDEADKDPNFGDYLRLTRPDTKRKNKRGKRYIDLEYMYLKL